MSRRRMGLGILAVLTLLFMLTGCVFGPKEDVGSGGIDPPKINYLLEDEPEIVFELSETDVPMEEGALLPEANKMVERTLYVFDHQGYVVPVSLKLPYTQSVAKQALEYLVEDGPVTSLLPDGMRAVLPAGTEVTVNVLENGKAVVDFSKEFATYRAEDEKGILEAVTWTLTQFDSIQEVALWINGYPQSVMPVNGTPISGTLSRKDGINLEVAQGTQVGNSMPVTLYFKGQSPSGRFDYFVPVTRLVPKSTNLVQSTVEQLISGPGFATGLYTDFLPTTHLLSADLIDSQAVLDFDEQFLRYAREGNKASDAALSSLVLSLTETGLVERVQIMVNGERNLFSFNGQDLSQPVTRPLTINASSF